MTRIPDRYKPKGNIPLNTVQGDEISLGIASQYQELTDVEIFTEYADVASDALRNRCERSFRTSTLSMNPDAICS